MVVWRLGVSWGEMGKEGEEERPIGELPGIEWSRRGVLGGRSGTS